MEVATIPWALRGALRIPAMGVSAFIPLTFKPGEAYQFDWSHEDVEIAGKPPRVKVARMRQCVHRERLLDCGGMTHHRAIVETGNASWRFKSRSRSPAPSHDKKMPLRCAPPVGLPLGSGESDSIG